MAEDGEQLENKLFCKVKYKISGNLPDRIVDILRNGGAEGSNYFSDYHTHCIVGTDPADTDITDAKELYEIPAVTSEWVSLSHKCGKLLPVKPFLFGEETLFTNVTACLSEVSREDCSALWGMIRYYGGACSLKLTPRTTHLIVGKARGAKYEFAISRQNSNRYIVTPDWVLDSISLRNRAQEALYHPRLLIEPEREKKMSDLAGTFSTAHITGFADDEIGVKEEDSGGSAKLSNELLEHLKQSMPWNQQMTSSTPPTSTSSTFPSSSLMNLDIKEEPKMPSQPATPLSVPQSPVNTVPQSKPQPQQLMQQVQQKSQIILQQQQQPRLQQMTPTTQIAWRGQVPVSQQQMHIQQQQLQVSQAQQQLQVSQAQQQLQVSQAQQQLQVSQAQQQLQVSQAQQQLQVSQAQQLQLQQPQSQPQQSVLVQQQAQLIQQQAQQQQIITQTHQALQQQPQIIQQSNILQQNLIQQAGSNLVQQPQTQNLGQQQIISQQTTLLLSPQNQIEPQQFITTQQQLIQRPQQSKPAIQQQQFIVREATPQLQQQQFTDKPVQFQWQQQYSQNRQQLVATPQVQPRQITWMQQPQGVRQLIQMDAQTHAQLQQMDPAQRTLFLQRFQKQRQLALQRQLQAQQQNRGIIEQGGQVQFGVGVVRMNQPQPQQTTVIQRQMPPGINQLQWIQQQRQNQIRQQALVQQQPGQQGATLIRTPVGAQAAAQHQRLPVNVLPQGGNQAQQQQQQQQQPAQQQWQTVDGSGLQQQSVPGSPQQQIAPSPQQQQQIIIRHQQLQLQRLQQLQLQKQQQQQQQQQQHQPPQPPQTPTPGPQRMPHYVTQVNMMNQGNNQPGVLIQNHPAEQLEPTTSTDIFGVSNGAGQPQLVNPKTKTALANMLSSRLQSGGVTSAADGSAAGQLRMMTAQHQAASLPPPPPPQPAAHQYQRTTLGNVNAAPQPLPRGSDMSPTVAMAKPAYSAQTAARVAAVLAKSASGTPPANHQHRPQFYGHTPNFKIPSDMFLLGCVFLIMEYDRTGYDVTTWRRIILENGGETELTYSARVTHILCQTQKHPLVQQGLRDGKRCVTAEWLSDVMIKQQVLPPWLALHFPTPFSDEKPCRNLIICHSGFEGDERVRVKKMIEAVGAKMTSYYTSHNNILVCKRPEGEKYKKAREWGRSVVNVQWLNEVLFGHFSCLQHPENQKYQQFNIGNPFRIDYTLVPHLMGAWKVPIQVTQECYERAKSSGIVGPKRKRPRLTSPTNTQNMFEQENMFPIDSVIPPINHGRPIVLFSGSVTKSDDERKIYQLGGLVAKSYREATHLVTHKIKRTFKLMCGLSTCKYVVSVKWLNDSFQNERFLDEQAYIVEDAEFETKYNCSIQKVLFNPNRSRLFSGKTFFITPGVTPSRAALSEMVHAAGGHVDKQRKSLKHIQELDPESYITVTVWNDFHLVSDLIRAGVPVYSAEFIMTAILTQKLPFETAFKKSGQKNKN